jgi:hypothetical protein
MAEIVNPQRKNAGLDLDRPAAGIRTLDYPDFEMQVFEQSSAGGTASGVLRGGSETIIL